MEKFNIVTVPPGQDFFREIAETVMYGLRALGHDAGISESYDAAATNIILGFHLVPPEAIPSGSIIYNFEQIGVAPLRPEHYRLGQRCTIWDYSASHVSQWAEHGCACTHVELGYAPELTRIQRDGDPRGEDIDVLFYGAENDRRQKVMQSLRRAGVEAQAFWIFGDSRDRLIARAKIVLNVHYYESKIFEIARVSYLLANRKAVVTEESADEGDYAYLQGGMVSVPYGCLVTTCLKLLADEPRREQIRARGFELFSQRSEAEILRKALTPGFKVSEFHGFKDAPPVSVLP